MKRVALILSGLATFAAADPVRLYLDLAEVTTVPTITGSAAVDGQAGIGGEIIGGVVAPINRHLAFKADMGFILSGWSTNVLGINSTMYSRFQTIGAGFQINPVPVLGLSAGLAYDLSWGGTVDQSGSSAGSSKISGESNVTNLELGGSLRFMRDVSVVAGVRVPLSNYESETYQTTKLTMVTVGLRWDMPIRNGNNPN